MNERPSVRERLTAGERCYGTMAFDLFTPALTAVLADCGYDFVILDTEHSGVGIETMKQQIAYARGLPIEVWVRVPQKTYAAVATILDAGATGVMVPMLETAEEARALVEWARYQPEGRRGLAFGIGHDAYRGRDPQAAMAAANARNCVLGLIETKKGIENCDAILATPGFDLGWLGHFDLPADLGCPAQWEHPDFLAAVEQLAAAGKKHKKALGSLDANPEFVGKMAARGFTALGYGSDVAALRSAYTSGLKALKAL